MIQKNGTNLFKVLKLKPDFKMNLEKLNGNYTSQPNLQSTILTHKRQDRIKIPRHPKQPLMTPQKKTFTPRTHTSNKKKAPRKPFKISFKERKMSQDPSTHPPRLRKPKVMLKESYLNPSPIPLLATTSHKLLTSRSNRKGNMSQRRPLDSFSYKNMLL